MSTVKFNGTRVVLPKSGPDPFWQLVFEHFAGDDQQIWKCLAMLALRENAGWPLERIGQAFGHHKGHVSRLLIEIKERMRERFSVEDDAPPVK